MPRNICVGCDVDGVHTLGLSNERNSRTHMFFTKQSITQGKCAVCHKLMCYGMKTVKCRACQASCHAECQRQMPVPCVPVGYIATCPGGTMGIIADFTPTAPMVASLMVLCINEVKRHGLNDTGIYILPGGEKDVKILKGRFLHGKKVPNLPWIDIRMICDTIKDFVHSLC